MATTVSPRTNKKRIDMKRTDWHNKKSYVLTLLRGAQFKSAKKTNIHGWDDSKIYFWDREKENCVNDYPELVDVLTEICQEYFAFRQQKIERAKGIVTKQRAKKW